METYRRDYRNEVESDLKCVRTFMRQNEDTIYRLTHEKQAFRVVELVAAAREKLKKLKLQEEELVAKVADIEDGLYDEKLKEERIANMTEAQQKAELKKKGKPNKHMPTNKEMAIERRKNYLERRSIPNEREMAIEYERYLKANDKLPPKLRERLKTMPGNRGIVFNQVWFFGEKPDRRPFDTVTIDEKMDDGFYVRYYTPTGNKLYRKEGYGRNAREVLVSRVDRPRIPVPF